MSNFQFILQWNPNGIGDNFFNCKENLNLLMSHFLFSNVKVSFSIQANLYLNENTILLKWVLQFCANRSHLWKPFHISKRLRSYKSVFNVYWQILINSIEFASPFISKSGIKLNYFLNKWSTLKIQFVLSLNVSLKDQRTRKLFYWKQTNWKGNKANIMGEIGQSKILSSRSRIINTLSYNTSSLHIVAPISSK